MRLREYREAKHTIESVSEDNPVPTSVAESSAARTWQLVREAKNAKGVTLST